jgi:hypothetical protein
MGVDRISESFLIYSTRGGHKGFARRGDEAAINKA